MQALLACTEWIIVLSEIEQPVTGRYFPHNWRLRNLRNLRNMFRIWKQSSRAEWAIDANIAGVQTEIYKKYRHKFTTNDVKAQLKGLPKEPYNWTYLHFAVNSVFWMCEKFQPAIV